MRKDVRSLFSDAMTFSISLTFNSIFVIITVTLNFEIPKINVQQSLDNNILTYRITKISVPDISSPRHKDHQIVMALSPKKDNKIWIGTVS